jgi:IS605 OrfB family transposase
MQQTTTIKTLSVRIRDKHAKVLSRMAFEVNQVWNLANEMSRDAYRIPVPGVGWINGGEWLSAFDIQKKTSGLNKQKDYLIGSATVQEIIAVHARARHQFKKSKLNWRISSGSKRALGWVPFKLGSIKFVNGQVRFAKHHFKIWDSYGLSQYEFRSGSFSQDARGRWYLNVVVQAKLEPSLGTSAVGIDLGLKDTATCSDGTKLDRKERYRTLEAKLGIAQRANKSQLVKTIHAKIKNQRKDDNHKFSSALVNQHGAIFVGNVSSSQLARTRMAKSVLDAGWYMLKTQLEYKAIARSVVFSEVNEKYTTQTCSCCLKVSGSSPKGRSGLGIREWTCAECGTTHDRDINAARNILRLGHQSLAVGIPSL